MQLGIDTLQISERNLLLQDHLVECRDEVGIQEATVEDAETQAATDELEVVQVLGVDAGRRVDLEGVVVVRRVLKQTVEGVEHLVREHEEEFSEAVVSNILKTKQNSAPKTLAKWASDFARTTRDTSLPSMSLTTVSKRAFESPAPRLVLVFIKYATLISTNINIETICSTPISSSMGSLPVVPARLRRVRCVCV